MSTWFLDSKLSACFSLYLVSNKLLLITVQTSKIVCGKTLQACVGRGGEDTINNTKQFHYIQKGKGLEYTFEVFQSWGGNCFLGKAVLQSNS